MFPVVPVLHACHTVLGWFYNGSIGFTRLPALYCFQCNVCVPRLSKLVHLQSRFFAARISGSLPPLTLYWGGGGGNVSSTLYHKSSAPAKKLHATGLMQHESACIILQRLPIIFPKNSAGAWSQNRFAPRSILLDVFVSKRNPCSQKRWLDALVSRRNPCSSKHLVRCSSKHLVVTLVLDMHLGLQPFHRFNGG